MNESAARAEAACQGDGWVTQCQFLISIIEPCTLSKLQTTAKIISKICNFKARATPLGFLAFWPNKQIRRVYHPCHL